MKNQACTTEELAKTKEPNRVHEFAKSAMLQTKPQQTVDTDYQRLKMPLSQGNLKKKTINKD
ncbi:hypothetical protein EA004_22995 [Vibrio anguillarum]|uniref:hypothetical protein n=1 Tax=Vibrio TaxID=662 RepID=UPI0015C52A94|nr:MULTISPECIES: hypothetical protein [Vibrio]MBF4247816.1 hypothetical protein [Vibrio anguillarum]MBF4258130.1 hypothetical protein [Vibrio anguillarum]MBF4301024.1 hypothetical protein [Vibrio anguillarum]MBF4364106.1 hypothetical protein [Vibrio anguillarum]MDF9401733.1 hypothetical protein [Vibrio sp. 1180_3]